MSADDETLYKRLQDNYPHAYALARQISIKFTEILQASLSGFWSATRRKKGSDIPCLSR